MFVAIKAIELEGYCFRANSDRIYLPHVFCCNTRVSCLFASPAGVFDIYTRHLGPDRTTWCPAINVMTNHCACVSILVESRL